MKKVLAIATIVVLATGVSAQAVLITSSLNGPEFYDDFEGASLEALPGYWNVGSGVTVQDITANPDPGPIQGSKYIALSYPGSDPIMSAMFENGVVSSGTLHVEWMAYVPIETNAWNLLVDTGTFGVLGSVPDSVTGIGEVKYHDGAWNDSGITFQADQWQKWELDIDVASDVYTISVDGNTTGQLPFRSSGGIDSLDFYIADNATYYVDAVVPEPGTITMLLSAVGMACLVFYRQKRLQ